MPGAGTSEQRQITGRSVAAYEAPTAVLYIRKSNSKSITSAMSSTSTAICVYARATSSILQQRLDEGSVQSYTADKQNGRRRADLKRGGLYTNGEETVQNDGVRCFVRNTHGKNHCGGQQDRRKGVEVYENYRQTSKVPYVRMRGSGRKK